MSELNSATPIVDGDIDDAVMLPVREGAIAGLLRMSLLQLKNWLRLTETIIVCLGDETTPIAVGTNKVVFRLPYGFVLSAVRASLTTAQATSGAGGLVTVDINENGASILSTKLTIDNTEKTSTTAATAAVISDVNLADDAELSFDVDQVGDGTATGLKVYLIGKRA